MRKTRKLDHLSVTVELLVVLATKFPNRRNDQNIEKYPKMTHLFAADIGGERGLILGLLFTSDVGGAERKKSGISFRQPRILNFFRSSILYRSMTQASTKR